MKGKKKFQINKYFFVSILSICFGIFVWWLVTDGLGIFRSNALPSPVKVFESFIKKWYETKPDGATLLEHLIASLQVALGGYVIGAVIGIPLGIFMAWNDKEALYRQRHSSKAMIKLIDDQIGLTLDLLEERGMLDDTLILFTSDHGDMLGDHYLLQKGVPWRQAVNVPLAVRLPGAAPIGVNPYPVELSDLAATILDYAGLAPAQALSRSWPAYNDIIPCRSLLPVLRGETERCRDFCFAESDFTEERVDGIPITDTPYWRGADGRRSNAWQSIITETSKYIKYLGYALGETPYEEFYDLTRDPMETQNCVADPAYRAQVEQARARLAYMVDHHPAAQKTWCTACAQARGIR
nr:sulfatase-like hydrolase/transferase [uncultured Agathobaculum sp.]